MSTPWPDPWFDPIAALPPKEREKIAKTLPSHEEVQLWWGLDLLRRPTSEHASLVAAKIEVLRPLWADPEAWCSEAIALAEEEMRRRHAER